MRVKTTPEPGFYNVYLHAEEYSLFKQAADNAGLSVANWMQQTLTAVATVLEEIPPDVPQ